MNSIYDEQFSKLSNLTWLPWIGKSYTADEFQNKVLLIGESHYLGEKADEAIKYENSKMTRWIAKDMGVDGNKLGSDFFANTYKLIFPHKQHDESGRRKLWDNVAFYNFIQRPMANSQQRPTKEDLTIGRKNFVELLNVIKPSVCLFLGTFAERNMNIVLEKAGFELIKPISWKIRINGCWGRYGRVKAPNGDMVRFIFVRHPSQYFSADIWHQFLQKYIPEQLNWLNATEN